MGIIYAMENTNGFSFVCDESGRVSVSTFDKGEVYSDHIIFLARHTLRDMRSMARDAFRDAAYALKREMKCNMPTRVITDEYGEY